MRTSSSLLVSSGTAMGLTATAIAIAVILLASSFTVINAQQLTSQPGQIENGTATTTLFQSRNDSFSVQVPQGWVIQDMNNSGSVLLEEATQGYGLLAQLCPEEQQGAVLSNASGSTNSSSTSTSSCQGAEDVIHIIRYPDLDTRLQAANNVTTTNNMTTENILAYHLQKLEEVGYRGIQTVNSADMTLNLTNAQTNQTIATVPAKTVEMTYTTASAPNETRNGYFVLTFTNVTAPNLGTTKGYSVFYEGNSTTTAEITTASGSLTPLPPAVGQVFGSFELIAAPEVAPAIAQEEAQAAETTEGVEDNDDGADGGDNDDSCHPSYPDTCIPPPPPNLNCDDVNDTNFEVDGSDPHGFDGDNDGTGCEDGNGGDGDTDEDGGGDGDTDEDGGGDDDGEGNEGEGNEGEGNEGEGNEEGEDPNEFEDCVVVGGRSVSAAGC